MSRSYLRIAQLYGYYIETSQIRLDALYGASTKGKLSHENSVIYTRVSRELINMLHKDFHELTCVQYTYDHTQFTLASLRLRLHTYSAN